MKLTKTSAHAVLAMAYLSMQSDNGLVQARQVADQLGIPTDSALKILQTLARQGLIQSQLGRAGGYQLHRSAHEVTLLEVVDRAHGVFPAECPVPVMDDWVKANAATYDFNKHGWPAWYPTRTLAEWESARALWQQLLPPEAAS